MRFQTSSAFRALLLLVIAGLSFTCGGGNQSAGGGADAQEGEQGDAVPEGDGVVGQADAFPEADTSVEEQDALVDAGKRGEREEIELPVLEPVTFIKAPFLQWPTRESITLLAETTEETPLDVVLEWEGGAEHFYSSPTAPRFQFLGAPLEPLSGFWHQLEIPLPEGVNDFSMTVQNGQGWTRKATLPQSLDSLRMVVFGDTRTQVEEHKMVVDAIMKSAPVIVVHTGDLVATGMDVKNWNEFFEIEGELLSSAFFLPVFGNHEFGGDGYFNTLFQTGNNFNDERNWWIDLGIVGVIGIEQYNTDWSAPEPLAWLEGALEKLQGKRWLFFVHHEPMYTFSKHDPWLKGREFVKPLLDKYGVDMVFSGHNHCYEHFIVDGVHYVVSGGGGAPLYNVGEPSGDDKQYFVSSRTFYHYVQLDLSEAEAAITVVDAETGEAFEQFDL